MTLGRSGTVSVILFALTVAAAAQTPAEQGRSLAIEHCSRCHVVDPAKPFTGIGSTPSFRLLLTAFDDWEDRFETFYTRLPHPSVIRIEGVTPPAATVATTRPVELKAGDIDAIVAFVSWLKQQQ